jgi:FlaG/FlaF family flagellin (archaellin)
MKISRTKRNAVAPVLATLMMIAVAVAMSVIIFVWSQGFLSQTSSAAGGQQSQQNIAAQSSVSIDSATFTTGTTTGTVTLIVRNVGSVGEVLGTVLIQGTTSNAGLTTSVVCTSFQTSGTAQSCTAGSGTPTTLTVANVVSGVQTTPLAKSNAVTISVSWTGWLPLASGDLLNVKVSTTAGTFASQQFTVP